MITKLVLTIRFGELIIKGGREFHNLIAEEKKENLSESVCMAL